MKTIEDAVIQFGGVWPEFSWEESKQNKHAIVKTIKQWEDAEEGKIYHKGHIGKGGTSVDPEFCEVVCTKPGFESEAKNLGYINGYRWGVEYGIGDKIPLPDGVLVQVRSFKSPWSPDIYIEKVSYGNHPTAFRITDQRYKPADTSYLNASTQAQSLTHSEGGLTHSDSVKSPKHYQVIEGVESITIIASAMTVEQWHGFCLGNILKYRIRAGKKGELQQDIAKADYYQELYEMHKHLCRGEK